jgi:uncharacterized protein (TIGR03435 family)
MPVMPGILTAIDNRVNTDNGEKQRTETPVKRLAMGKPIAIANLIWMACCAAFGQNAAPVPAPPPEFEVATVKPTPPSKDGSMYVGVVPDPAFLRITGMSLENLIEWAYDLKPFQLLGPDWMKHESYDVVAKMPAGAGQEQVPAMLQTLLERRFQLKFHREPKVAPVYALVVSSGGLKIHPSKSTQGGKSEWQGGHMEAHAYPLASLASSLQGWVDRPVVDETGVQDVFDFTLDWAVDEEHEAAGIPSMRVALMETLGLKLEARKLPVEMLVIDHIEKKPSEN